MAYSDIYSFAFNFLISNEGGLEVDPNDPGGVTNFGLSKRAFPDVDIAALTRDQAQEIYATKPPLGSSLPFWLPVYEQIFDERLAAKIFDMAVNMGQGTAHVLVQAALGMKAPTQVFGPLTLGTMNSLRPNAEPLLLELSARAAVHYAEIVARRPDSSADLLGWMRRACKVPYNGH